MQVGMRIGSEVVVTVVDEATEVEDIDSEIEDMYDEFNDALIEPVSVESMDSNAEDDMDCDVMEVANR